MLHEPASKEQQQYQQSDIETIATFTPLSNICTQHVAKSKRTPSITIPTQLSNQSVFNTTKIVATSQQHVDNNSTATSAMLLVVGQRKIGASYLKPKPSSSTLLVKAAQPDVAQENVDAHCMLQQHDAKTTLSNTGNNSNNNNDNSKISKANLSCLQTFSTNAAGKMLLVHNNNNNKNNNKTNNKITNNNNNNNNNKNKSNDDDDKVVHVPQYADPDPEQIKTDFNRRRRRGRLRCAVELQQEEQEKEEKENKGKTNNDTIKTTSPPPTTTTATERAMSAFLLATTTTTKIAIQATAMPTYTTKTTTTKTTQQATKTAIEKATFEKTVTPDKPNTSEKHKENSEKTTTTTTTSKSSSAYLSTLFGILLFYSSSASIKIFAAAEGAAARLRAAKTFCRKLAKLLLLSSLFVYLKKYVNTITSLVLSTTPTTTTIKTTNTNAAALAARDKAAQTRASLSSSTTASKQNDLAAASTTSAATFAVTNNKYIHHRYRNTLLAAATQRLSSHGGGNNSCCCYYKQLIYVFLLFTNILPRHSYNLYAEAAKPKSATHNQHQHHQQQQGQQQQEQNTQLQPYNVDNNVGVLSQPDLYQGVSSQTSMEDDTELLYPSSQSEEQLFDMDEDENAAYETSTNATHYANVTAIKTPLFPKDIFTKQQLEDGWVFCHIIGVIYMFVALAIVCDEFFVPSLDVIIEKLDITDDVAGATFMAAGGSAPELFTSVIGVFVSFDDVGIGTIVGSAVFNILFVIGMCALFSKTVLTLTWWPLFRDCTFYSISLIVLIIFFRDNKIYWYEALILFSIYIGYVVFMKWNVQVERFVKKLITRNQGNAANSSETSMATQPGGSVTSRAASETRSGPAGGSTSGATGNSSGATASSTQTGAKFRHGLLQLMIHTIDPLHDDDVPGKVDEKATQLHAIASLKVLLDATKPQRGGATTSAANHVKINLKETTLADRPNGNIDTTLDSPSLSGRRPSWIEQRVKIQTRKFSIKQTNEIEDEPEPLSMAWPDTARKRLTYILVAPLLIPMWLTLPDTRSPRGKKFFAVTFCGSILWIAAFSYLMVWWANVAGETAKIPPEVMGLTFLAAGTSIPDLITSVIVARKGYGDMAVSSSVGSNIFDVTVGLPIPWLLYGLIYGAPVEVNSVGMVCSITILFMMLLFVVMSIACFRWRMNKGLGFTMFLLYFVFVAVSLMFEYDVIRCPV